MTSTPCLAKQRKRDCGPRQGHWPPWLRGPTGGRRSGRDCSPRWATSKTVGTCGAWPNCCQNLAKRILPWDVWTFHGLRPANRPERRLALAACWLSRPNFVPWLDDWVCQTETRPTPAAALLGHLTASDEYWSTHWTFRSGRFPKAQPLLGAGRLHDIAVNVILPWLYARASADDNTGLRQRVVERYFAWPKGQDNSRLRFVRQRLLVVRRISLRGAAVQQVLLQVQADFCNRTNALCDDCVFPDLVHRHSLEKR